MNRRLRNPSGSKIDEKLQKFLKPGALARIRDSKISARSPRSAIKIHIPVPRLTPPSSPPSAAAVDGSPCFAARIYGPRFLQRKKLIASKRIFFIPSSPVGMDPSDSGLDLFSPDLIVAH